MEHSLMICSMIILVQLLIVFAAYACPHYDEYGDQYFQVWM